MKLRDAVATIRETGDVGPLQDTIPYARFMGISCDLVDGDVVGKMRYSDHLIGDPNIPALHGGTLGAFMESTAIFKLLWQGATNSVPKTINITVEYLRGARAQDVYARAVLTRRGRRIANVRVFAYQNSVDRPVAMATAHFLLT